MLGLFYYAAATWSDGKQSGEVWRQHASDDSWSFNYYEHDGVVDAADPAPCVDGSIRCIRSWHTSSSRRGLVDG